MTSSNRRGKFHCAAILLAPALIVYPIAAPGVAAAEKALQAEKNPPGDIPDSQVFVPNASPLGFALQVPEGWSRVDRQDGVRFFDKYNTIDVGVAPSATAPTAGSARSKEAAALALEERAVTIASVREIKLKGGPAVEILYSSNSAPNSVTSKQIRLEHERLIFFKDRKAATADLAAPQGADNADQWRLMANSFRWK
jgi:hypothetical protein